MRQVLEVSRAGTDESWCVRESEEVEPGPQQVRIDVKAACIQPRSVSGALSWDVAGVLGAVGDEVQGLRVGDEVWAYLSALPQSGYCQSVCVASEFVARKPVNLSFSQAAAVPGPGLAAHLSAFSKARVKPGQKVLITGASRGAGFLCVQMCRYLRAGQILVTAGSQRSFRDLVDGLGLSESEVIAYSGRPLAELQSEVLARAGGTVDVAIDFVGHRLRQLCFRVVGFGGQLVVGTDDPWSLEVQTSQLVARGVSFHPVYLGARAQFGGPADWKCYSDTLRELAHLFESGQLHPPKLSDFGMISPDCIREAHALGAQNDALGQMVVHFP